MARLPHGMDKVHAAKASIRLRLAGDCDAYTKFIKFIKSTKLVNQL